MFSPFLQQRPFALPPLPPASVLPLLQPWPVWDTYKTCKYKHTCTYTWIFYRYTYMYTPIHTHTHTCIHMCVSIIHTHDVHYQDLFCPHRSVARERRELTLLLEERAHPASEGLRKTHTHYTHTQDVHSTHTWRRDRAILHMYKNICTTIFNFSNFIIWFFISQIV